MARAASWRPPSLRVCAVENGVFGVIQVGVFSLWRADDGATPGACAASMGGLGATLVASKSEARVVQTAVFVVP